MFQKIIVFLCLVFCLISCNTEPQYAVIVKNSTDSDLLIEYKTRYDIQGEIEEAIPLKVGEMKVVINTIDLKAEDSNGVTPEHHQYVAEYIRAYKDGAPSKLNWYDDKIKFEKTDIGQAEFTIEYTDRDF